MAFNEKSAWVMVLALGLGMGFYVSMVTATGPDGARLAEPGSTVVGLTILLVVVAVAGHALIAAFAGNEANAPLDEREQQIVDRAARNSGFVLPGGIVFALAIYLFTSNGDLLFYLAFSSLILGHLAEYILRIVFYRVAF